MITISAVILAGGLARRMGGVDKGLQLLNNQPLVAHTLARLKNQIYQVSINANRNIDQYTQFGVPVFQDEIEGFQGPLSGMLTALRHAKTDYVLFVPCDCPYLPLNLEAKLQSAVKKPGILCAYAHDGEREHPTFCLISRQLLTALEQYLASGERRMLVFLRKQHAVSVDFSEQKSAFRNFNTLADLQEQR